MEKELVEKYAKQIRVLQQELMLKNTFIAEYHLMQEYKRWYKDHNK